MLALALARGTTPLRGASFVSAPAKLATRHERRWRVGFAAFGARPGGCDSPPWWAHAPRRPWLGTLAPDGFRYGSEVRSSWFRTRRPSAVRWYAARRVSGSPRRFRLTTRLHRTAMPRGLRAMRPEVAVGVGSVPIPPLSFGSLCGPGIVGLRYAFGVTRCADNPAISTATAVRAHVGEQRHRGPTVLASLPATLSPTHHSKSYRPPEARSPARRCRLDGQAPARQPR